VADEFHVEIIVDDFSLKASTVEEAKIKGLLALRNAVIDVWFRRQYSGAEFNAMQEEDPDFGEEEERVQLRLGDLRSDLIEGNN
jgi:hypothetical protein